MSFNIGTIIGLLGLVISAVLWAIACNKQRGNGYAAWLNSFFPNHPDPPFFTSGSVLRAGFLMGIFVLLSLKNIQAADISSTTTGGSWSAGATWVGGSVPSAGDNEIGRASCRERV